MDDLTFDKIHGLSYDAKRLLDHLILCPSTPLQVEALFPEQWEELVEELKATELVVEHKDHLVVVDLR